MTERKDPHAQLAAIKRLILADLDATSDEELRAEMIEDGKDPDAVATAVGAAIARVVHSHQMAQTNKERQEALRARRLMLGMTEVRGIFLHPDQHAELKEYARKLAKKRKPEEKK